MNNKNEMIALELTKSYVDKCNCIDSRRVIEVYNNFYTILTYKEETNNEIDDLRLELGQYKAFYEGVEQLVQPDKNFVYIDDIQNLIKEIF